MMSICGVLGLGQLGHAVATYLADHGVDVIAVDRDLSRVEAIKDHVGQALCLDVTDERAMRAAGLGECSTVVLSLGEEQLEQAVLATMILRELAVGRIIARAATDLQAQVLRKLGVGNVLFPEREMGHQIARRIITGSLQRFVGLSDGLAVAELKVPSSMADKTLDELDIRVRYGVSIIAIRRRDEHVSDDTSVAPTWTLDDRPGPTTQLSADDIVVVVGPDNCVEAFGEA